MLKKSEIQTKWNLALLYRSATDPQIERDLQKMEQAHEQFAAKYQNRADYLSDPAQLAQALADYEKLSDQALSKPYAYFSYLQDLDGRDTGVEAKLNLLAQRYTKSGNKLTFFPVLLSKISRQKQAEFLKNDLLKPYRYLLQTLFQQGQHTLTEPEEKIMNLKSLPASQLWVRGNEKVLAKQIIRWRGQDLPLPEAMNQIVSLPTGPRRRLAQLINQKLLDVADFAESELNALVINKKINDDLRGYAEPYSATVLAYENEPATVENLVQTVTASFPISHRFYKLKAKMLKLRSLTYADRAAPVGKTKKEIPFVQAVEIVRKAFAKVNPIYAQTLDEFLQNGQIDVFPKAGKLGGAYCSSHEGLPTFLLLNHLPDFHSVSTLAHEMGHALHYKFSSENQPPLYRGYSTATAEVASTLFENFVFDEVFALLSEKEKIVALHDKLNDSISTIFRQVACFNFELELHRTIRERGNLSKEEIARLLNKHMQSYLGPMFKLTESDGYFFVTWSHLRNFFYVYSYAFGELVSSALYASYQKDQNFEKQIRQFLSAGGSASPEDIFAQVGVDVRKPNFFRLGLAQIERDIQRLEEML